MHRFTREISPRRARGAPGGSFERERGRGRGWRKSQAVASRRARIAFMNEVKAGSPFSLPPFEKRRGGRGMRVRVRMRGRGRRERDDRGAAVNTRLLVMRREKPSPPPARDTCNFAPRKGRGEFPLPRTPSLPPPGREFLRCARDYKGTPSTGTRGDSVPGARDLCSGGRRRRKTLASPPISSLQPVSDRYRGARRVTRYSARMFSRERIARKAACRIRLAIVFIGPSRIRHRFVVVAAMTEQSREIPRS